jgi:hypothetical protein
MHDGSYKASSLCWVRAGETWFACAFQRLAELAFNWLSLSTRHDVPWTRVSHAENLRAGAQTLGNRDKAQTFGLFRLAGVASRELWKGHGGIVGSRDMNIVFHIYYLGDMQNRSQSPMSTPINTDRASDHAKTSNKKGL